MQILEKSIGVVKDGTVWPQEISHNLEYVYLYYDIKDSKDMTVARYLAKDKFKCWNPEKGLFIIPAKDFDNELYKTYQKRLITK